MPNDEARETDVLAEHLRKLVEKRLERLCECSRFEAAEDPAEALHDLRVASRRLRAFIEVFRSPMGRKAHARADKALRRATRAAGTVRDHDVQLALVSRRREQASTDFERAILEHLLEALSTKRAEGIRRARKRLCEVDFDALSKTIREGLGEAIADLPETAHESRARISALLSELVAEAALRMPPDDGAEHPGEMHQFRVVLKKLRYALELFGPMIGKSYEIMTERAVVLQEILGDYHDLIVFEALVERAATALAADGRTTLASGLRALLGGAAIDRRALFARSREARFDAEWWREAVLGMMHET